MGKMAFFLSVAVLSICCFASGCALALYDDEMAPPVVESPYYTGPHWIDGGWFYYYNGGFYGYYGGVYRFHHHASSQHRPHFDQRWRENRRHYRPSPVRPAPRHPYQPIHHPGPHRR